MRRPRSTEAVTTALAVLAVGAVVAVLLSGVAASSSHHDRALAVGASSAVASAVIGSGRPTVESSGEPTPSAAWLQVSTWPAITTDQVDPAALTTAQSDLASVLKQANITDALHPRLLATGPTCNVAAFEMAENGDLIVLIFASRRDADGLLRWKPSGWISDPAPDYSMTLALGPGPAGATCSAIVRDHAASFDVSTQGAPSPSGS